MALVLMAIMLINVAAAVGFQLSTGFTDVELGKYLLWYVLPATWDVMLLAVLAVFVQALSPHKRRSRPRERRSDTRDNRARRRRSAPPSAALAAT
jgi:hypothetical protein